MKREKYIPYRCAPKSLILALTQFPAPIDTVFMLYVKSHTFFSSICAFRDLCRAVYEFILANTMK